MSQTMYIKMEKDYPFGQLSVDYQTPYKVIVTRKIRALSNDRQNMLNKARLLKQLQQNSVVNLYSYKEEGSEIEFNYEYVPIKFENWMQKLTLLGLQKFQQQLFHFIYFLSYNQIIVRIRPSCIGLTSSSDLKYFVDFDFYVDSQGCKNAIFQNYKKQIDKLCQLLSKRICTPESQTKPTYKQIIAYQKNSQSPTMLNKNQNHTKSSKQLQLKSLQGIKEDKKKTRQNGQNSKSYLEQATGTSFDLDMSYDASKHLQSLGSVPDKLLAQARQILGISLNWRLSNDTYGKNLVLYGENKKKQYETDSLPMAKSSPKLKIQTDTQSDNKKYQDFYYNQYSDLDQSAYFDDFTKVLNNDSPKKQRKPSKAQFPSSQLPKPIKSNEQEDIKVIQKKVTDAIMNSVLIMQKIKQKKN